MNVSTVTGIQNLQVQSGNPHSATVGRGADKDGDSDASGSPGSVRGRQDGGQALSAVAQTLSQLGVGQVGQIAVTAPSATQKASGNNNTDSAPSNNVQNPVANVVNTFA